MYTHSRLPLPSLLPPLYVPPCAVYHRSHSVVACLARMPVHRARVPCMCPPHVQRPLVSQGREAGGCSLALWQCCIQAAQLERALCLRNLQPWGMCYGPVWNGQDVRLLFYFGARSLPLSIIVMRFQIRDKRAPPWLPWVGALGALLLLGQLGAPVQSLVGGGSAADRAQRVPSSVLLLLAAEAGGTSGADTKETQELATVPAEGPAAASVGAGAAPIKTAAAVAAAAAQPAQAARRL